MVRQKILIIIDLISCGGLGIVIGFAFFYNFYFGIFTLIFGSFYQTSRFMFYDLLFIKDKQITDNILRK